MKNAFLQECPDKFVAVGSLFVGAGFEEIDCRFRSYQVHLENFVQHSLLFLHTAQSMLRQQSDGTGASHPGIYQRETLRKPLAFPCQGGSPAGSRGYARLQSLPKAKDCKGK